MELLLKNDRLSENFTVYEFTRSATASRLGIKNVIYTGTPVHEAALLLFSELLQPLRDALGHPLFITSGYRCDELNEAVGGVLTSQHVKGEAADIVSGRLTPLQLARNIVEYGLPFDQLIVEYDQDVLHVSHALDGSNRGQKLTRYVDVKGNLAYAGGLKERHQCRIGG